jgi:hypothetical protein
LKALKAKYEDEELTPDMIDNLRLDFYYLGTLDFDNFEMKF